MYVLEKVCTFASFSKQYVVLIIKTKRKMKKLLFLFVAVAAMSFASCGNKTAAEAPVEDSDSVAVDTLDTTVVDSAAADTVAAPVA